MGLVASLPFAPEPAFSVLIPRALQDALAALPGEARRALLAALFGLASREARRDVPSTDLESMTLEVAGHRAFVTADRAQARWRLTGLVRVRPQP
ncbi:hypothetical protein DRW03_17630 [Corallococcus sp. H22C18031201]|uniref:hypothetical protein n=1 Tax=Citreicoccus inhibens TaxID=2849499 RepID=UPI000E74FB11|nr:hypothetical protein [Citreicoccus inhibens]MBU8897201.1 hypothetical protein [Citreicoccus inhibens]RJS21232.1 hypothetical protein DRW03_17630 [Corallococcus sp. H22C18031201]